MSGLTYQMPHTIREYECDFQGTWTLPSMVQILLHVSGTQSTLLGNTTEQMLEKGLSWIIIQYNMQIHRMPKNGEKLLLVTQAESYNRFFTYRAFRVYDEQEQLCVEVLTTFATMDLASRKIVTIDPAIVEPYQAEETRKMRRLAGPAGIDPAQEAVQQFRVRYLDIDLNRHVNNAKYFDWIINTLDPEFITAHEMTGVTIKYEKEVSYGNMIDSAYSVTEENSHTVTAHEIRLGDTVSCKAGITWKKRV